MDRRIALKNMGLALGYTVATPTLIGLVQSCKQEKGPEWTPLFCSPEEGILVMRLADIILPKTDTPSATEQGVHLFIDGYLHEVSPGDEQAFFRTSLGKFMEFAFEETGKSNPGELSDDELESLLANSLKSGSDPEGDEIDDGIEDHFPKLLKGDYGSSKTPRSGPIELDDSLYRYAFATQFRDAVIKAYRTTEYIGEEVLAYLPVPGEYIGCGDLNELTGGKAWSI